MASMDDVPLDVVKLVLTQVIDPLQLKSEKRSRQLQQPGVVVHACFGVQEVNASMMRPSQRGRSSDACCGDAPSSPLQQPRFY